MALNFTSIFTLKNYIKLSALCPIDNDILEEYFSRIVKRIKNIKDVKIGSNLRSNRIDHKNHWIFGDRKLTRKLLRGLLGRNGALV